MKSWLLTFLLLFTSTCFGQDEVTQPPMGWLPDEAPAAREALIQSSPQRYQEWRKDVDNICQALEEDDRTALVYRFLAQAEGVERLDARNQGSIGSCTGFGGAGACDITYSSACAYDKTNKWKARFAPGAIYALSRTVVNRNGRWDGSTGAWICQALRDAAAPSELLYENGDLRLYSVPQTKEWATRGFPKVLTNEVQPHQFRATVLVETWKEARALLQNGYGIITCSMQSYSGRLGGPTERDAQGFARNDRRDSWPHAMAVISYRGEESGKQGFLIINSWGPNAVQGPVWPEDQPTGSFWVSVEDFERHLKSKDTWAVGDFNGFTLRVSLNRALDVGGPNNVLSE